MNVIQLQGRALPRALFSSSQDVRRMKILYELAAPSTRILFPFGSFRRDLK